MKTRFFKIVLVLSVVAFVGCQEEDKLENAIVPLPSEVSVDFELTQNNSGDVVIIPTAKSATTFDIVFGDGSDPATGIITGDNVGHTYAEGTYQVEVIAYNLNGESTSAVQELVVSFNPPQNLEVTIENDGVQSNTVNVTVNADFAATFDVDFGEDGVDSVVSGLIEETVTYQYQNPGLYDITVTVAGAAVQTTTFVEEDFEVTEILEPTVGPSAPTQPAQAVISIYSDSYTSITTNEFPTEWSDSGFEEIEINGNNVIKYSALAFTGIVTDYGNPTDLTDMDVVHFDYWTPDATSLGFKIVNTVVGEEDIENVGTPVLGEWRSVEFNLDDFDMNRSQVTQLLFDALGNPATVYIDNLYFYKNIPEQPSVAAPTPTQDASNVISIYSDAYTSITTNEFPTEWSNSGFEEIQIDGNNVIKYSNLAFTGIVTDYGNPTDLTGMTKVHFDYWTPNAASLGFKIVNTVVGEEDIENVGTPVLGEWRSVEFNLADYDMDRSQVTQLLFDALGNTSDVYIDNLYFFN